MEVRLARNAVFWAMIIGGLPAIFVIFGIVSGVANGDASLAAGIAVGGVLLSLPFEGPLLPLAWEQLFGQPRLVVEPSGFTIHHDGILRRPVRVGRHDVHSVYFTMRPGVPGIDHVLLPDLSVLSVQPNLLVVFTRPLQIGRDVRRGMGLVNTLLRGAPGPTRITYARGFVAKVEDAALATAAFDGWPTTSPIPQDVLDWLQGGLPGLAAGQSTVSDDGDGGPAPRQRRRRR